MLLAYQAEWWIPHCTARQWTPSMIRAEPSHSSVLIRVRLVTISTISHLDTISTDPEATFFNPEWKEIRNKLSVVAVPSTQQSAMGDILALLLPFYQVSKTKWNPRKSGSQ